jgi:hypothetical protein
MGRSGRMRDPTAAAHRPRLTPALVVAAVALAVALAGTGYAALAIPKDSVGTPQLKRHAVTATKIVPGAGITLFYTRASTTVSVAAGGVGGGFAACPRRTFAIGGGVGTNGVSGISVTESLPFNSASHSYSGAADAWSVFVANGADRAQPIEVYAVCVSAAQATASY